MPVPVLVTGVAGFIGHATAHRLLARGEQVIGIDIVNDYYDPALKAARLATFDGLPDFTFHRMDVADVAGAVLYMAELPLGANVASMTVQATAMPLVGRG